MFRIQNFFKNQYIEEIKTTDDFNKFAQGSISDSILFQYIVSQLETVRLNHESVDINNDLEKRFQALNTLVDKIDLNRLCIFPAAAQTVTLITFTIQELCTIYSKLSSIYPINKAFEKLSILITSMFKQKLSFVKGDINLLSLISDNKQITKTLRLRLVEKFIKFYKDSNLPFPMRQTSHLLNVSIENHDSEVFETIYKNIGPITADLKKELLLKSLVFLEIFDNNSNHCETILRIIVLLNPQEEHSLLCLTVLYNVNIISKKWSENLSLRSLASEFAQTILTSSHIINSVDKLVNDTIALYYEFVHLDKRTIIINNISYNLLQIIYLQFSQKKYSDLENILLQNIIGGLRSPIDMQLFRILQTLRCLNPRVIQFLKLNNIKLEESFYQIFINYFDIIETHIPYLLKMIVSEFPKNVVLKCMYSILKDPVLASRLAPTFGKLFYLQLYDNGRAIDSWSQLLIQIAERLPASRNIKCIPQLTATANISAPFSLDSLKTDGWKFEKFLGRTIIFENATEVLAVKVGKVDEKIEELIKEFQTTVHFHQHALKLKLKSKLPIPHGIFYIENLSQWMMNQSFLPDQTMDFLKLISIQNPTHPVYVYYLKKEHKNYFTYLHDPLISNKDFGITNQIIVLDLCTLFSNGFVYSQLADIFHNREISVRYNSDNGRYRVLSDLLQGISFGSGRLTGWMESVEYPNVRLSGLADLGDWTSLADYYDETSDMVKKFYSQVSSIHTGRYTVANVLAEYQFVLFLIAGRRGHDLEILARQKNIHCETLSEIWEPLANQIILNCAQMISIFTSLSFKQALTFLDTFVNKIRLTKQMRFWMTDEYIPYILKNSVPDDLYECSVSINSEKFRAETFSKELGFSIDGKHQDLGPVNGQEPIKEANKLFYWTVNAVLTSYLHFNTLHETVILLMKDKSQHSLVFYAEKFSFLEFQTYHKFMTLLCHKAKKSSLAFEHKKEYSAAVIQGFWKRKKAESSLNPGLSIAAINRYTH